MAKEGKKPIGKIVLGVIVVLVVAGVVGSMGGNSSDSSTGDAAKPAEQTQQVEEKKEAQEPYTVSDEAGDTSNQFAYKITGTLTNNTDKEQSYIQIEYVLYDADGNQVTTVQNNTWYKVAIPVKAVPGKTWGTLRMFFSFEAPNTSATVYLRNADYGNANIYAK